MGESFSVGEIAILHNCVVKPWRNGVEVEVISSLAMRRGILADGITRRIALCYRVMDANGYVTLAEPCRLRKRRPPQDWKALCNLTDAPRELETV